MSGTDSDGNQLNTINSELLQFMPGSLEERAFTLLHVHGVSGAPCPLCLLVWLARLSRERNFAPIPIEEIRSLVYRQGGIVLSACFEVLLHPEQAGAELRFEDLASTLGEPVAQSQLDLGLDDVPPPRWLN